jgi:aspartate aminotransferase/aromatic-amino-acid transaminase
MIHLRIKLAEAIKARSNSADFDFIAEHRGMFSLLGLPESVVQDLKVKDAVYMINDSRINVAGIPEDRVGELADALLKANA